MIETEVIILGAGAAGFMCAIEAGKRHRQVLILDKTNKFGKKILMSGGGRCNFTNYHVSPQRYISHNPHFCKSALSRYTQWDFIELVKKHQIPFHEKTLGQLFCDNSSKDIVDMLYKESQQAKVRIQLNENIETIEAISSRRFKVKTTHQTYLCQSLVVATGGLSIPTMGASPFGYQIATQFHIPVWPTRAGLVPLTLHPQDKNTLATLSGISNDCIVSAGQTQFRENILFTHRGLSGPAILQISNYWESGQNITLNLLPELDLFHSLKITQQQKPQIFLKNILAQFLPKRVVETLIPPELGNQPLQAISHAQLRTIAAQLQHWQIKPQGTEGYRTAEVTLGGVDCDAISSKTFEAHNTPGLYFIGEVLDVTGWLGGYNFQWAWSSGWAAGQVV